MADNLMKLFMQDAKAVVPVDNDIKTISELAEKQRKYEELIIDITDELEKAKEELRNIQEYLLPEAMLAAGVSEFKLVDGSKITIKDDVYASIRKDYLSEAVMWLTTNGLGGIVKDQVSVDFGKGEYADVNQLMEFCKVHGMLAQEKLSVHPSTLKATVKEQLAQGVEFPEEFFSVGPIRKAIIKSK